MNYQKSISELMVYNISLFNEEIPLKEVVDIKNSIKSYTISRILEFIIPKITNIIQNDQLTLDKYCYKITLEKDIYIYIENENFSKGFIYQQINPNEDKILLFWNECTIETDVIEIILSRLNKNETMIYYHPDLKNLIGNNVIDFSIVP